MSKRANAIAAYKVEVAAIYANLDPTKTPTEVANKLGIALDRVLGELEIEVDSGIKVDTTGSPTAQSGATTEKGKGKVKD